MAASRPSEDASARLQRLARTMTEYKPLPKLASGEFRAFQERIPVSAPGSNEIEIPLVATADFLASGCGWTMQSECQFAWYPRQLGLDQQRLASGDFTELPPFLMLAVLQQWLYFGFIEAVTGFSVDWSKAIGYNRDGYMVVDTNAYIDPVFHWFNWLGRKYTKMSIILGPGYNDDDPYQRRLETSLQCLTAVRHFATRLQPQFYALCPPIGAIVHLSILMLGERLQAARDRVPDAVLSIGSRIVIFESAESWGPAPILEERLLQADWCPGEVKRLSAGMNVCNQYFASLLARSGSISHEQCSTDFCSANQITDKFTGKHTAWCEGTQGTCRGIGPSPEKVVEVLKEGGIPVIEISTDPETGNLTLNVVKASSASGYTAVSHVWSDGLGNSERNELYACRLAYIHSCLQNLQKQEKKPLSFLRGRFREKRSISPVAFWLDTYCVPVARQYQEYRWQAIELIAETYRNARRVLVLDSEMQLASVKGERAELIMRLYCSAWMRRLWTLQEGVLAAKNLHVQLSDGAVNLFDDVWKRGYSRAYSGMTGDVRGRYSMFKYFLNHPYEYEALVFLNRFTRLSDMAQVPLHQRFAFAWDEVRWRSTSRKTDDTICFAGILGLNPSNLFQSEDDPETERLMKLFSLLDELPPNILFAPGLHMKAVGWTWAPAVLPKAYRSMVLELPRTYGNRPRVTSVARRDEQGLWVKLSGFVLAPRTLSLMIPFTISYGIFRWRVQPEDSHHPQYIKPVSAHSSSMSLGLILSDGVPADLWISGPQLAEATMPRPAVVVHLLGQDEDLIRCTYISRVNVILLPDANTPERGPSVPETQEACRRGFQTVDLERINNHHSPALITSDSQEWCIR